MGDERSKALQMFHAFTGFDTVSSFPGKGKKTAFQVWTAAPEMTPVSAHYMTSPNEFDETKLAAFEKFVIPLYDRTCTEASVDAVRMFLFTRKGRQIEAIPPTRSALFQHTKQAIHHAGFIWGQMFERSPDIPSPSSCGWKEAKP